MKALPQDRLVLVTSSENLRTDGFERIATACRLGGVELEPLLVDKFDLMQAFQAVVGLVQGLQRRRERVVVNVSGGTRLLADAAMLAAFHTGIECYHADGRTSRLPVLQGVAILESLSADQKQALAIFEDGMTLERARAIAADRPGMMEALLGLKKSAAIEARNEDGGTRLFLTSKGRMLLRTAISPILTTKVI